MSEPLGIPAPFGDVMETFDRISTRLGQLSTLMDLEPMTRVTLASVYVDLRSLTSECEALLHGWPVRDDVALRAGATESGGRPAGPPEGSEAHGGNPLPPSERL